MQLGNNWESRECWVASFDLLGFRALVNGNAESFQLQLIQDNYDEVLEDLNNHRSCFR